MSDGFSTCFLFRLARAAGKLDKAAVAGNTSLKGGAG